MNGNAQCQVDSIADDRAFDGYFRNQQERYFALSRYGTRSAARSFHRVRTAFLLGSASYRLAL